MDSEPRSDCFRSLASDLSACASRNMRNARAATSSPAGVRRLSARPSRTNSVRPSSSSSKRICLLTPGWEVCRAWAAVVTLRPFCTTAARYRSCCSFNEVQPCSVELQLDVDAGRKLELHERINRLIRRVDDVHDALVRAQLELVTRILVAVRRDQQRELFHLGRQRHRTLDRGARALGGLDDFLGGSVDEAMVECLEANADVLICHFEVPSKERLAS